METTPHVHVAIVGTGFAGIGTAVRLREDGIDDVLLFERAADLGGTWRDNSYPGCACDVPSHLYSFSFAPNPRWTHTYSRQPEIWQYLRDVADRYGVTPKIRYRHEVLAATWENEAQRWRVETTQGTWTADVLVSGAGALSEPSIPPLPGLDSFEGAAFHSAQWDHDCDLAGRDVAVIGTGASAIQFVPEIQKQVRKLVVFQRTPPWIVPRRDRPLRRWEHALYTAFPPAQVAVRAMAWGIRELFLTPFLKPRPGGRNEKLAQKHLAKQVADPELRAKLTPSYRMGCKRILISNDYYPALQQRNVELVTERIREVRPHSIVTEDGVEHEVDTIVFGTGFKVTELPIAERVRGRDGRTLAETWEGSPKAHLGTTVAGFPNLFILLGPNTGLGHTSVVFMIEAQIQHVREALTAMKAARARTVEPRPEAQEAYVAAIDAKMESTVWLAGGCASWYIDNTGRVSTIWPDHTLPFKRRLARFEPSEYVLGGVPAEAPVAPAPAAV
jgi:cation diffusion facilitator CzcD-associated flavoprotein CzcO